MSWIALGMTLIGGLMLIVSTGVTADVSAEGAAHDPGVRTGTSVGGPIQGLSASELKYFGAGAEAFAEVDSVQGTVPGESGNGLGPGFNGNSCGGCHAFPSQGGSSPPVNPQVLLAHDPAACPNPNACNPEPLPFIKINGPVKEVRFVRNPDGTPDGGVHNIFTIAGRTDAVGCRLAQPDFAAAMAASNMIFRIPTPVFGGGLIETIPDRTILENKVFNQRGKQELGIAGHENREGNTGTITRFGWKAQNKSLLMFAGEAYNVEMGVSNELFQNKRNETPECSFNGIPEDHTNFDAMRDIDTLSDITKFAVFMRFLAPPEPANTASPAEIAKLQTGRSVFLQTGCAGCHTPMLKTGESSSPALSNKNVNLYSDLLVHHMGSGLADRIQQGNAQGDEFRTAPLWGLGQRLFFLHDGRTSDLLQAIKVHASPGSEANAVIARFYKLNDVQKQALLTFLRSL